MGQFFRLKTAQLLFEKLTRDLACLESWQNDADMAFNFFVTADAILEWLYPGPAGRQQREDLRNDPVLDVVWDVASGATPLEVKRGDAPPQAVLSVDLTGRAAQKYGARVSAIDLARLVHAYWKTQFP
jgi:hypothetical protein